MTMRIATLLTAVFLMAAPVAVQDPGHRDERSTPVGVSAWVDQFVLPGSELVVAPIDRESPIVLRIAERWPHGTAFRYDLEYYGLEPGTYDLTKWLVRADGTDVGQLPALQVEVTSVLPAGMVKPNDMEARAEVDVGGYTTLQWAVGIAWGVGLLLILFVGRRRRDAATVADAPPPTLAERLRPMVEDAMRGELNEHGKANLERLLLAYWRRRLDLADLPAAKAIRQLRDHDEAGVLLRQLEEWLHSPAPNRDVDVSTLLAAYRDVPADAFSTGGAA